MSELPRPSDFELAILRVLWQMGAGTVRQVFEALQAERQLGYTTVLKTMQIMVEKGLLRRDESAKSHVPPARGGAPGDQARHGAGSGGQGLRGLGITAAGPRAARQSSQRLGTGRDPSPHRSDSLGTEAEMNWVDAAMVFRLGWTLIDFLWQGVALAGALALMLWSTKGRSPRLRYGLACVVLAVMAVAPVRLVPVGTTSDRESCPRKTIQ